TYQETRTYVVITQAKMLTVEDDEYFALQVRSLGKNEDDLIMNTSQVDSFNQTVLSSEKTNTLDLAQVSEVTSKAAITTMINAYQLMDKYTVYHQSTYQVLSANDKIIILNNRNLNGIDEVVNIQYAVSTQHTNVRSYPTNHYANSAAVDRFQETGFGAGIPMIIYHQSLDQEWYFIRMFNYAGWVHQNDIALCNRAMFLNYVDPQEFIVVTDPLIMIGFAPVRMGTVLPIQDGQTVSFPTRNANGTLSISLLTFPQGSYHVGYLSLTYRLLFHQAYKLLGKSYSWGDKNPEGLDCSSTQAAIYGCFGFKMGRNTSNQRTTNLYGKTISSQAISSISSLLPGTLLYTSSHVLMLLGVDQSGTAWLLHNTTSGNICKLQTLQSYGTSSILYILEIQPLS
ncbi:MAG: SH3 domain-containing protein, partial [Bacilli bacterium]